MANLNIKQEKFALPNGSYCIIQKLGGHIDVSTLELFEQGLAHLLSNNINQLVLNLADVTYISSSGMGLLIKYVEKFRESGGDIQISCVTPGIWTIFKQIGLNSVFGIFSSDKEALSAFRERANYNPITRARYPAKFKCPSCAGALEIGQPGKYRCIHCGT
ncbi:MAG: anti-sigma factor antagonist, partial [Planctomycetes bacterium]|nr:anti-sigma factor antagonist [Planctomycetota bacterium]